MVQDNGREIANLIRRVNADLNRHIRKAFKDTTITPPQMMIILMLLEETRMTTSAISEKMHLAKSTVSGILDRLEQQDLIVRERSKEDKRVVWIKITEKTRELAEYHHSTVSDLLNELVGDAEHKEVKEIVQGLSLLSERLKQEE
ncbi:MarR family winged helix-turn-helix transcriptional regulator [Saliterribacillus persicus]|uniref:DNA-binding MarR family transcriptional regulator n=1 Tax=Saliterribacillus persicus TaxID=930114 RepID=A0A368YBR1_9BACI|nr:MarR family transcriptional regulator [Saliterribacillus persicus]RCW76776.1 DNA-binding MarR family transcriptional regulator [Saliterribacillus persicus]